MSDPADPALLEDSEEVRERTRAALAGVERIVAVMSGKGGVGKSALAVNLAALLAQHGRRVGVLDADLHGPSVAKMLGLRGQPVRVGADERLRPVPGPSGLAVQSMDFFLQGNQALDWDGRDAEAAMWRSAMEQSALADLIGRTAWGELDWLIVDTAPGSDRLPALARWLPQRAFALAVTLPTEVSRLAVERSLRRALDAGLAVAGLVENFSSAVCGQCGAPGALFPDSDSEGLAASMGIPLLARVPFDPELARAADRGEAYAPGRGAGTAAGRALAELAERILGYPAAAEDAS